MPARDGRGVPGRYVPKNQPRLKLSDLLRRRKMTLKQMIQERGVTTYVALSIWCERIGVVPPHEDEFNAACPVRVNSPQEGVVVLEAPLVIDDMTGRRIDPDAPVDAPGVVILTDRPFVPEAESEGLPDDVVRPQKKLRRKREDDQPEQD